MNINLQTQVEAKYKVTWTDTIDYDNLKISEDVSNDAFLSKKLASYMENTDPLYYTFHYKPLIDVAMTLPNPYNLFQTRGVERIYNNHTVLEIPITNYFFKGMKTFYRYDEFAGSMGPKWFGEETIAFKYARRYHGGLNAYKPIKPIKLLVYTNIANLKSVIDYYHKKGSNRAVFLLKIKTGINISFFTQIDYYLKYNNYKDIWLNRVASISSTSGKQLPVFKGLMTWGRGKIDRDIAQLMCEYCMAHDFDGYISYEHYSPFMAQASEEIVLCDYMTSLKRDTMHQLDWVSWQSHLPITIESNFVMDENYASKNNNFQIIKFYNNNIMNSILNKKLHQYLMRAENNFVFGTLNVHSFYPINKKMTAMQSFDKFILFLKNFNVDLICLQEVKFGKDFDKKYIEHQLGEIGYNMHFVANNNNFGNAIICKHHINFMNDILLPNADNMPTRRALLFKIDYPALSDIYFCATHLEIGLRYTSRAGPLLSKAEILENMKLNSDIRISQLQKITQTNPHIIMGDLNFTPNDPEYKYITQSYKTYLKRIDYTTPFNTITDYVFYKKKSKLIPKISLNINYRYSDHLPVLNVLNLPLK